MKPFAFSRTMPPAHYSRAPMAATTPAAIPISGPNLAPAPPVGVVVAAAAVLVGGAVVEAAEEDELDAPAPAFTVVGSRVPHFGVLQL